MERRMNLEEVLRDFEGILRDIEDKDDKIVIEREDQPVAVVVPVTLYWQWLTNQEEYTNKLKRIADEDGVPVEEVEANELANEAIWWVRGQRRRDRDARDETSD
jgi:PHD/YefM family antitoxin component YafN of YafNO toxin-antitoxin module